MRDSVPGFHQARLGDVSQTCLKSCTFVSRTSSLQNTNILACHRVIFFFFSVENPDSCSASSRNVNSSPPQRLFRNLEPVTTVEMCPPHLRSHPGNSFFRTMFKVHVTENVDRSRLGFAFEQAQRPLVLASGRLVLVIPADSRVRPGGQTTQPGGCAHLSPPQVLRAPTTSAVRGRNSGLPQAPEVNRAPVTFVSRLVSRF